MRLARPVLGVALVGALVLPAASAHASPPRWRAVTLPSPTTSLRVVAGSGPITDSSGQRWSPDVPYAVGGRLWTSQHDVAGTTDQALFRTERVDVRGYRIPVSAVGTYRVTLNEAENYWSSIGQRVFDVTAEGHMVASKVDLFARAGRYDATALSFDVPVSDGSLDLTFTNDVDVAKVDSLSVVLLPPVAPAPATVVVTPEQYGARGDGTTDDTAALQRAFDSAPARSTVLLAGTYAHGDVLHLRTAGLHVTGPGTLLASNESRSSVWIEADNVLVDGGLTIRTAHTTQRWSAWEQMGLRINGHQGITLRNVTVDGAAAAGVYVGGQASGFTLDHVTVLNSRADGIHMTDGSHDGQVISPTTVMTGDDGVAVVSYGQDGAPCHDITVTSPRVLGTTWGRGLSVVGGTRVTETNIDVERTDAAGVYIAAEGDPWYTAAPQDVSVTGGRIVGANTDTGIDHGAVLVMSGETGPTPTNVVVKGLAITDTRSTVSRDVGVITYGTPPTGIVFDGFVITGGPNSAYQGNTPDSSYHIHNWVQNGAPLPDHG